MNQEMYDTAERSLSRPSLRFAMLAVLILLAVFLTARTITELKGYRFIGGGVPVSNTVTVSGEGEVFAVPDIATFSLSVVEKKDTVAEAQETATQKINKVFDYLKGAGIEEKDIKTQNYSVYPQYEYRQEVCTPLRCPPGTQVLTGYEVNQTLSVKVRDTKKAGELLTGVGEFGISNVSGLDFTIDEEEALQQEARKKAIDDAKEKAEMLADDLGVILVRIVNFNESGEQPYPIYYDLALSGKGGSATPARAPEVPVGENKIVSNVSITYEIR